MRYIIAREMPGRMRVHLEGPVPESDMGALCSLLDACPDINAARVYPLIGSIAVTYEPVEEVRSRVLDFLSSIERNDVERMRQTGSFSSSAQTRGLLLDIAWLAGTYFIRRWLLPNPLAIIWNVMMFLPYLRGAGRSLSHARLDVPVLDASAIAMSLVQGNAKTAGETMFLLSLGETLEDYTEARSQGALIDALMHVGDTAQLVQGDTELQVKVADLRQGDLIAVRTGMPIVVDGCVEAGLALVNQASLTGEPLAVERTVGDDVFAGTSVEEGEILVRVKADPGQTRIRSIVSLVKSADQYQSARQARREQLAARIVPWNFLLAGIVALVTRSIVKTSAALMVDYSCGLKLTGSIAVLSAACVGLGAQQKCSIGLDEACEFTDKYTGDSYEISFDQTVGNTTTMSVDLTLDDFNRLFGNDADYFSGYASDLPLALNSRYVATEITPEQMMGVAEQMQDSMGAMAQSLLYAVVPLFLVLIYLLTKTVIDRSARSISYMKVFGYHDREISKLYVRSITVTVLVSLVLCLPIIVGVIDLLVQVMMSQYSGNLEIWIAPQTYAIEVLIGAATYAVVALLHMRRIRRVPLALAMKVQE